MILIEKLDNFAIMLIGLVECVVIYPLFLKTN